MSHNFLDSLKRGTVGEDIVASLWPELVRTDGRKGDFELGASKLEVKTESRSLVDTANFFFERYSNFEKKSPGGVFQAAEHGTLLYAHFFIKDLTLFIFFTSALGAYLKERDEGSLRMIPNRGYKTAGWIVPRDEVKHLYVIKKWESKV